VQRCFGILGVSVMTASLCAIAVRFSASHKQSEQALYEQAVASRQVVVPAE
jgi:NNP family nitrate/nitrite transporter-like MFS transporter